MFPHHENEIAQSEAASGKKFVHTWMHNGAVRVDDEKMSKSLGNFFTIREVLKKYPAEVIRYFLVSSHYVAQLIIPKKTYRLLMAPWSAFTMLLKGLETRQGVATREQ